MSQSTNQKKYGILLDQFLNNDTSVEQNESEQMKQWLEEAANKLRSQFESHRGNNEPINYVANETKAHHNNMDELEMAMCVSLPSDSSDEESGEKEKIKKRARENYLSDIDSPLAKRLNSDQPFLNDVLDLDMISLSSVSTSKNLDGEETVVRQMSSQPILEKIGGTSVISKAKSTNISAVSKQLPEGSKYTNMTIEQKMPIPTLIPETSSNNSTCVWPVGVSYQPDFIEIVVTDDEMNTFWNTIHGFF